MPTAPKSARATVTSVADLGVEAGVFMVYGAWAFGGLVATAAYVRVVAALVGALFTDQPARQRPKKRLATMQPR